MEIEKFIDYIKEARKRGFRDDVIKKSFLDKGWPESDIDKAFLNAGKPKRAELRTRVKTNNTNDGKTSITILLDDWMKKSIDKSAKKDNLTFYNEVKKMIVNDIPESDIPKGVVKSKIVRKKLTEEEKERHNKVNKKYKKMVKKERKKRRGVFGGLLRKGKT